MHGFYSYYFSEHFHVLFHLDETAEKGWCPTVNTECLLQLNLMSIEALCEDEAVALFLFFSYSQNAEEKK